MKKFEITEEKLKIVAQVLFETKAKLSFNALNILNTLPEIIDKSQESNHATDKIVQ